MSQYEDTQNQKAVALKYDMQSYSSPVIIASGKGDVAERIIAEALKYEVPVYKDDSLVNVLEQLELGSEIPPELYRIVVDIYVYLHDIKIL